MRVLIKTGRLLLFFWLLLQAPGVHSEKLSLFRQAQPFYLQAGTSDDAQLQSSLYSPETLTLPDALVSPIPSFQFGSVETIACYLCILFCLYVPVVIKERIHFFTSSYFHTLFSSLILINAP